jgi:glutamine synthetase
MGADQSSIAQAKAFNVKVPREYIRFAVVDFNGKELSKVVPKRHRGDRVFMYSGAIANGANAEVLFFPKEVMEAGCPNWELEPDWSTERILPWASSPEVVVSRVFCGQKNVPVPRAICERLLRELAGHEVEQGKGPAGLELLAASELEFMVASRSEGGEWKPIFDGTDIFATMQFVKAADLCYEIEANMEAAGVDVKTMNAEYGQGQLEITFAPKFGIAAADDAATFKTGVKEIAHKRGLWATFMSRPFGDMTVGNGGHFNFSLWRPNPKAKDPDGKDPIGGFSVAGKDSAMHSSSDPDGLSDDARRFLAGVLAHGPALEALCAPTPACYTRHGNWAPKAANWGPEDRLAMVRVKADPKGSAKSCQMELRAPSASACGYLVLAGLAAAGLDGLQRELDLPPPRQPEAEALALPTALGEALEALEADEYMVNKLGKDFVNWYCGVKREELKNIDKKVGSPANDEERHRLQASAWQHMYFQFV